MDIQSIDKLGESQAFLDRVLGSTLISGAIEGILYHLVEPNYPSLKGQVESILISFCRGIFERIIKQGIAHVDLARVSYGDRTEYTEELIQVDEKPAVADALGQMVSVDYSGFLSDLEALEKLTRAMTLVTLKGQSEGAAAWLLGDETWEPTSSGRGLRWN